MSANQKPNVKGRKSIRKQSNDSEDTTHEPYSEKKHPPFDQPNTSEEDHSTDSNDLDYTDEEDDEQPTRVEQSSQNRTESTVVFKSESLHNVSNDQSDSNYNPPIGFERFGREKSSVRNIQGEDLQASFDRDGKANVTAKKFNITFLGSFKESFSNYSSADRIHYIYLIMSGILLALLAMYVYNGYQTNRNDQLASPLADSRKTCKFDAIRVDFPNQSDKLWKSLSAGIETVLNSDPTKPSIFLLSYEDQRTAIRFVDRIIYQTSNCMNIIEKPLILNERNLTSPDMIKDYGVAIQTYKPQLEKSGVMLVMDLNQIPASVAQSFHVFCDTYNPAVARSIIYMTMPFDSEHRNLTLLDNTERNLRLVWRELKDNILNPLLTRITDQVLLIRSEYL